MSGEVCGWYCPLCGASNAPHVNQCPCTEEKSKSILDNIPVKMNEEAKNLFGNKEDRMVTHSKEH